MKLASSENVYVVSGNPIGQAPFYRLYLCEQQGTGRECLLQIARDVGHNGELDRLAFLLGELKEVAQDLEAQYAQVKTHEHIFLNYDLGFPEVIETFTSAEQEGRRVNILGFREISKVSALKPLTHITRQRLRIDVRTSVWIMGKLLKLLTFVHEQGMSVGALDANNILIEPEQHYVLIFDWLKAEMKIPSQTLKRKEIRQAAKAVLAILGVGPRTNIRFEPEEQLYIDFLRELARGREASAKDAHAAFYALADQLWPRGKFYPFTTQPL